MEGKTEWRRWKGDEDSEERWISGGTGGGEGLLEIWRWCKDLNLCPFLSVKPIPLLQQRINHTSFQLFFFAPVTAVVFFRES